MMTEQEKHMDHLFVGLLIGGALGALAGILFAPKPGKQLRSEIKEKGNSILKDAMDIYDEANMKAKEIIEEARHQAAELKKDANRHLSETSLKTKAILARHENKQTEAGAEEH